MTNHHKKKLLLHALFSAACLVLCTFVLLGARVAQSFSGQLVLWTLTLVCACVFPHALLVLRNVCPGARRRRVVTACAALYLAFSLTGNRLFVYPIDKTVTALDWALFLAAVLWAIPITVCLLALLPRMAHGVRQKKTELPGLTGNAVLSAAQGPPSAKAFAAPFALCTAFTTAAGVFALIVLAFGAYWLAYNPAVSSWDTLWQFSQATGTVPLHSWHSIFHTLLIHRLLKICFSASFVALVQCGMVAVAAGYAASVLVRMGLRPLWILLAAALWAFAPNNATMLLMLQKDVPYTAALMWAAALFTEYVMLYHKKSVRVPLVWYAQYFAAIVLVWVLRTNGMIAAVVLALGVLVLCPKKKLVWATVGLALLCSTLYVTVGYAHYGVPIDYGTEKYKGLVRELCAVDAAGKTHDEQIKTIAAHQQSTEPYNPYLAGNTTLGVEMNVGEFLALYLREGALHPVLYARSILCRMDLAWGLPRGENAAIRMPETQTMEENGWWAGTFEQRKNYLPAWTNALTRFVNDSEQGAVDILFWRPSFLVLAGVLCAAALLLCQKGHALWLCVPAAAQMLSLLLTTPWNLYRYFWPLGVCVLLFCAAALGALRESHSEP